MLNLLKTYWPAALLALAVLAVIDGSLSSLLTCHPVSPKTGSGANQQQTEEYCTAFSGPLLSALRGVAEVTHKYEGLITAAFTVVLAVFTGRLWYSTEKLWNVTKIAAEVAQVAAEYIPVVEGAYVYVIVEKIDRGCIDDASGEEITEPFSVEIALKNFGKTPAFIQNVVAGIKYVSTDGNIDSGYERFFVPPETLIGAGDFSSYRERIVLGELSQEQAHRIRTFAGAIILDGTLVYTDIWGNRWTTPFDGRYDPDAKRFNVAHQERKKTN
jgi:hypothetical protein